MNHTDVLKNIRERFRDDIIEIVEKSSKRAYVEIAPASLRKLSLYLFKDLGARFNIASGMDTPDHMEILYHFTLEDMNLIISLRVKLKKDNLVVDSLVPIFEAANWVEREIHELLGINFTGHPDLRRLLLDDEWPAGVFPLRRDYREWDPTAIRDRGVS